MKKKTIEIKEGQSYFYADIEKYAERNGYQIIKHGINVIGENFLVLKNKDTSLVTSFMLHGGTANDYIYKCIHTDIIF